MPSYPTRKTKNGTVTDVRFRIIDENGKEVQRRLCGYPTKRAAQQAYLDFMKSYTPPTFQLKKDGVYTFDELFSLYKKKMEAELAASSFYDLNSIYSKFLYSYFTGKSLPALTKVNYATWQTELWSAKNPTNGEYYSQRYLSKIRSTLMAFLSWCEETYDIPNLYKLIKKPKRKEMKTEMQFWKLDEFLKFQNTIDDVLWKTFFMSLFYSGCRVGEIRALSDNDVVFENGTYSFVINKGITRKSLKADKKYVVAAPKTSTSNRTIPLPDIMTAQIAEYLKYKKDNNIGETFLFGGNSPLAEMTFYRYFEKYTEKAELKKIRIHDLRHSHASMLIHLNVPITVVSKRLGHSSIDMTLKKYAHCYAEGENAAINTINNAILNIKNGTDGGTN